MVWKNPWYDPSLKHHTPNGFRNTLPVGHQPGDLDRWRKARKEAGLPKPPALGYDDFIRQWWQSVELAASHEDGVWWLGHASVLLQLDGNIILTDPVFSRRASPLPFLGPQRKRLPYCLSSNFISLMRLSSPIIITIILMTQPFAGSSSAFPTSVVSFRWAWPTGFVAGEQNAWSNSTGGRVSPGRG